MLVLSTLPHYLSIRFPWIWRNYIVILLSSFSVLWHLYGEPKNLIFYFDYLFTVLWFLSDISYSRRRSLQTVFTLNAIVFITGNCLPWTSRTINLCNSNDIRPQGGLIHGEYLNSVLDDSNLCIKYNTEYWFYHSLWHILSSAKCFYISRGCRVSTAFSSPYRA